MTIKLWLLGIMAAVLLLWPTPIHAQVNGFNSGTFVNTGNSNSIVVDTNLQQMLVRKIQLLTVSGLTNVNGTATGTVYLSFSPTNLTGAVAVGQFTYTGSNNLSTNFISYNTNPPVYTVLQAGMGTNSGTWFFIYGP